LISNFYDRNILPRLCNCCCSIGPIEKQRKKIVPSAKGVVLEIGIGTGLNLPFYNKNNVTKIIGLDPSEHLTDIAKVVAEEVDVNLELIHSGAEKINLGDNSVDTVLITYTLCTIPDIKSSISEIKRVLKNNGDFIFCEHGKSPDRCIANIQSFINPIWGIIFGGCNINRDIPKIIHDADFKIDSIEQMYLPGTPKFVGYNYWGVAKK
jgi:ubiquinone/menaquinone biosynthesis C-methylase UbiE